MDILKHLRPDSFPQSEPLHGKQVENRAGGYVEPVSGLTRLERFLILGTQGGTYYVGERELTLETVKHATQQLRLQPEESMRLAGDVSDSGRGLRNDPAILLLALACADKTNAKVREHGFAQFHRIIRTGGHLLLWFRAMRTLGANVSSGASRRTVGAWMTRAGDNLAYQFAKYPSRIPGTMTISDHTVVDRPHWRIVDDPITNRTRLYLILGSIRLGFGFGGKHAQTSISEAKVILLTEACRQLLSQRREQILEQAMREARSARCSVGSEGLREREVM